MKKIFFITILTAFFWNLKAQNSVSIGTEEINPNAVLQLVSPDNTQGFLVTRLTTVQRETMSLGVDDNGMLVFDIDPGCFFYWHSSTWFPVTSDLNVHITGDGATQIRGTFPDIQIYSSAADTLSDNEIQNLSQVLSQGNDAGLSAITNLQDPANDQDAATKKYVDNRTPAGVIVMWSGIIAGIPAGWALCDGNNGTPDLTDRFILSVASTAENPGTTGGNHSYILDANQLPAHNHEGTIAESGEHTHTNTVDYQSHTHGVSTDGSHRHQIDNSENIFDGDGSYATIASLGDDAVGSNYRYTASTGNHSHTITGDGNHNHTVIINTEDSGHTHTFTTDDNVTAGTPIDNRPGYYKLAFIMKL